MATYYYGDSIGGAANSEERARERWLNLQLANREFLARERARADSINAQNAQNAMAADRAGFNNRLAVGDRNYQIERDYLADQRYDIETRLGLEEAEKERALRKQLTELQSNSYLNRLQQTEDNRLFSDVARRVATDEIQDIPSLQDAEGGRLGSDEWVDLKTRLGQHQSRRAQEAALGPELTAQQANMALRADPSFATNPAIAMNTVARNLGVGARQVLPNYERNEFQPRLDYKYSGPRDAIDWYRSGGTPPPPPPAARVPAAPPEPMDFITRMGLKYMLGPALRRAFPPSAPPQERVATEAVAAQAMEQNQAAGMDAMQAQKRAEWRALTRAGMGEAEAAIVVEQKYRNPRPASVRTY